MKPAPEPDETAGRALYRAHADAEAALSMVPRRRVRLLPEQVRYCSYCDAEREGPRCTTCGHPTR